VGEWVEQKVHENISLKFSLIKATSAAQPTLSTPSEHPREQRH
jgi:hypothetical protein